MRFDDWLKSDAAPPQAEVLRVLQITRVSLWRVANGKRVPSAQLARRIEVMTGGAVLLADMLPSPEYHAEGASLVRTGTREQVGVFSTHSAAVACMMRLADPNGHPPAPGVETAEDIAECARLAGAEVRP